MSLHADRLAHRQRLNVTAHVLRARPAAAPGLPPQLPLRPAAQDHAAGQRPAFRAVAVHVPGAPVDPGGAAGAAAA
ncbi:MAG: hypothetical protein MZV70_41055 [Desulfobacterales bacterium]|nr:hypothetical protein [Desulfobacterales bacterium]